ncbi:MarR family transcriptional regulator [Clostridium sp. WILCCON 0269]|uniref:MarR family transcriptional regulator n=1 Tax=Candidatus Clostridium eludens TaxID=3381663 RepID=A0ABW8SKU3_9CLOT
MDCNKNKLLVIKDIKKNLYDFFLLTKSVMNNSIHEENLPIAQLFFLYQLKEHGPYKVSELAKELGITPAAVTNLSNKFVNNGFIYRYRPESNRRVVMLCLTDKGDNFIEELNEIRFKFLEQVLSTLNEDDLKNIVSSFSKLNYAFENYKNENY